MSYYNYHDGFGDIKTAWLNEESRLVCQCGTPDIAFSDDDQNECIACGQELPRNLPPVHKFELLMDCDGIRPIPENWKEEIRNWLLEAWTHFQEKRGTSE